MKNKVLYPILALVLALSLALPMAGVVSASPATMTVVSDTSVLITGVYNKAGGVNTFVDRSSSPLSAVRAWEPDPYSTTYPVEPPEAVDSTWDDGVNWFENNGSAADWIWETHLAEGPASYDVADPLYDADAARYGRVVLFETTFNIPGNPIPATLHIAADNGYEAWVNSGTHYRSSTAAAGWETSNLYQAWLTTSGWQSYGTFVISGSELVNGSNTLYVLAGNEYFGSDDGNSPTPPTQGTWNNAGYHQYNPGAAIFQLDVEYEEFVAEPEISVVKEAIEVNGEPIGDPKEALEGDTITYAYNVTNTGNVPLYDVELWDDMGTVDTSDDVQISLSGLTDEDADTYLDDLAVDAWATGTRDYIVPWFTVGPVVNEATASGWYDDTEYTDDDDESVDILHNPDIDLTKEGPIGGYFQTLDADYSYTLESTGDCSLNVTSLTDDSTSTPVYEEGDTNGNGYLDPDETWYYSSSWLLECDPEEERDKTLFTNVAEVEAEDAEGTQVSDTACWTVVIFQWLPRTIGYWGNWDNHYTEGQFDALLEAAIDNSPNIATLNSTGWYGAGNVHNFLLGKPPINPKDGKDAFAQFTMEKQFLATWLNVKAYIDWINDSYIDGFTGSGDAAMNPDAIVYLTAECMPDGAAGLFEADALSVEDLLMFIKAEKTGWHAAEFGIAYEVLDIMNNAESNNYCAFIDPDWDPAECPPEIQRWPESGTAYIGYEDWTNGDFDYNDFGMNMAVEEWYEDDVLTDIYMTFEAVIFDSGARHYIHILRSDLVGDYSYDVTRSGSAYTGEIDTGSYTDSGDFDVTLFNTAKYTWPQKQIGETVSIHIYDFDTPNSKPSGLTPPRSYNTGGDDFYDLDPLFDLYDPWMDPYTPGWIEPYEWHIGDTQVISNTGNQKYYPAGEAVPVGTEVPMILVVPYTDWIPPYEDTTITGPYGNFNDFYTTGSPADWWTTITNATVEYGGLSW